MPILSRKRATRQAHPSSVRFADSFPPRGSLFCCRAASPLAAVAVCGGGKYPGGMNPVPTMRTAKRDLAQACGPGMPGPYRAVPFPCPRSRAGVRGCFLFVCPARGAQIKKAPSSGAENDGAKRNKQTAKGAEQNAETEAQPVIGRSRAGEAKQPAGSRLVMVSSC